MLTGRRLILGVAGGVAAYKSVYLARRMIEEGAELRVVMSDGATRFVGPHSFAAVSGHPVATALFGEDSVSPHTELAAWADAIVVAPATASVLARLANGLSVDLLSALLLAARSPVLLAPAMHTEMWEHPATTRNAQFLRDHGFVLVGPETGALAGGDEGPGRMSEPDEILRRAAELFDRTLEGRRVVVTAGGTREALDPVRYVGNRSSGKMGHAVADEAAARGAEVTLITTSGLPTAPGVQRVTVESAEEMAAACWREVAGADVAVLTAAVADFRPKAIADSKLRRADGPPEIVLEPTPDILAGVAAMEHRPFLVGFAAETGPSSQAIAKAQRKGVDLLVAYDVTAEGSGFSTDTNQVTLIRPDGSSEEWPLASKRDVAARLWDTIALELGRS